jgi:Fe-S cluster assembly scaffold protein SufB
LEYYKSFYEEAAELSRTLPEEQSELYKRYFLPLPIEQFSKDLGETKDGGDEELLGLEQLSKLMAGNLGIKVDAVIGSTRHLIESGSEFLKILNIEEITEEQLAGKMHKSAEDKLVALVHATSKKYVFINVPDGKKAHLNLLFTNYKAPLNVQVLIKVGKEAELDLFEWYSSTTSGKKTSLLGVMHETEAGAYSKSEISIVHNEDYNTYVLNFSKAKVAENGRLGMNYIYNGGLNTRAKSEVRAEGYASRGDVVELVIGSAEQKFDLNTVITNVGEDTISDIESKSALMDKSFCLLKGFANVEMDARGSRSFVNERGILLDKTAYMSSIPGMSIKNANVKATHSSATAPVDKESEFYLMSRGADEITARRLLISGFFSGGISKMGNPIAKSAIASLLHEKINNRRFGTIPKLDISDIWFDSPHDKDLFGGHYKYRELQ